MPDPARSLASAVIAALALGAPAAPAAGGDDAPAYMNHEALLAAARELAGRSGHCRLDTIGASRQGRGLLVLTLAADPAHAETHPALLLTAGLDGDRLVGTEVAIRVARHLLDEHAGILGEATVYLVPRANPDGAEINFGGVVSGRSGNARVVDEDRDGTADEDGPVDLNGDGFITMMRRPDPPLDDHATHLADPDEPRLLRRPEAAEGERATYAVYTEGLDQDGDGRIAEDGPGGVDLDRNFMHRWPEYDRHAGPYPLSEPESLALARFVIEHPNIACAVTFGRHDDLVHVPAGGKKDRTGRAPRGLHADDVAYYKEIASRFTELTSQKRAPEEDFAGSFAAWLYAQRGIPSFATVVWGRPDPSAPEPREEEDQPQAAGPGEGPDRGQGDNDRGEDRQWLAYSDRDRGGAGFVPWKKFDHPTLGAVEIGGFVPGFRANPPAAELEELGRKETAFVLDLLDRSPHLVVQGPDLLTLAEGLYDIRLGLVNEGYFPTATAQARAARAIPPTVVRLSTPLEDVVAGERVSRVWGIDGSGGRATFHWIIRAEPGATLSIDLVNRQLGDHRLELRCGE